MRYGLFPSWMAYTICLGPLVVIYFLALWFIWKGN